MSDSPVMQYPLQLRPCASNVHAPAAWFIPGDRPEQWFEELTAWRAPLANTRIYPIPRSASDNRAVGVLAVLKDQPERVIRALPYGKIGDEFYLPADAKLDPEPPADELARCLHWDVAVLHPASGLVGFRAEDAVTIASLLAPPARHDADWNCARSAAKLNDRLRSVRAETLPGVEQIIQSGRDDIGAETQVDVPLSPDESPLSDAAQAAFTNAMLPLMSALKRLLSIGRNAPGDAGKASKLRRWAAAKLESMRASLEAHRFRELQRLMDLMSRDPDLGLKFALPLRDVPTRGLATPSATLGTNQVDFNLSSVLGGGKPADRWNIPADIQQNLRKQYRDAANRELNLGRYRRAAYIFAHLLGDFASAASALKQGRHHREAAALYLERLNNKRSAADCLMEGGLLGEAIPLYHELEMFEIAGDLHERLGEHAEAVDEWDCHLDLLTRRNDVLGAAKLLETKLGDSNRALRWLENAWPNSDKAELCLAEWFNVTGRLSRHSAASRRIASLREQTLPGHRYLPLVRVLSNSATRYPDANVRARCADATRVIAGNCLMRDPSVDRRQMVEAVMVLAPGDRLLDRDGHRFLTMERPRPRPYAAKGSTPIIAMNQFNLPGGFTWAAAAPIPGGFIALGASSSPKRLTLVRGARRGVVGQAYTEIASRCDHLLLLAPTANHPAVVAPILADRLHFGPLIISRTDEFDHDLTAIQPAFVDKSLLGACRDESGVVISLSIAGTDRAILALHDDERILSSHSIDIDLIANNRVPMAARRGKVYIASGNTLHNVRPGESHARIPLPAIARGMASSDAFATTKIIVTFDDGGVVIEGDSLEYCRFGQSLISPVAAIMPGGLLVAVGKNAGQIYPPDSVTRVPVRSFETAIAQPFTVLPGDDGEFLVFDTDGRVIVYRLPGAN